ncbi:MAG: energy transducer TonB [Thermodesulfobacteriota bacterium]
MDAAKRPNWPLRVFLALSLAAHLALILHVSGLIKVRAYTQIQVGLMNQAPPARALPRPRLRPPQTQEPTLADPLQVRSQPLAIPQPRELAPASVEARDAMAEAAPSAEAAGLGGVGLSAPAAPAGRADLEAYYEAVRLRIEREKRYPPQARRRQIEGRVTLDFSLGAKGDLQACRVAKSSGNPDLDRAAQEAVQRAAPFPPPPAGLGRGGLRLELTVAFELS